MLAHRSQSCSLATQASEIAHHFVNLCFYFDTNKTDTKKTIEIGRPSSNVATYLVTEQKRCSALYARSYAAVMSVVIYLQSFRCICNEVRAS